VYQGRLSLVVQHVNVCNEQSDDYVIQQKGVVRMNIDELLGECV
jgi:hypothetical protein